MPAFLHHVYNRATVLGAKFRFGRPNFFHFFMYKKLNHDNQNRTGQAEPGFALCLSWFFCF